MDTTRENIERIEVIRGSAGVTWGVNAMNGVINIITKKAADTQGGFGYGGFGNRALQQGYMRLGGTDGQLSWRATTGVSNDRGFGSRGGKDVEDWLHGFQCTGRADLKLSDDTKLAISGGHKISTTGAAQRHSMEYMNLLWQKNLTDDSSLQVRLSENFYKRRATNFDLQTREDMLEVQHNFVSDIHNIVWGADYTRDIYSTHPTQTLIEAARPYRFHNDQVSGFVEDEITLAKNLWLTVGSRLHYNEITHYDWAGRVALVREMAPKHFIRAAISRSFRRPILSEEFSYKIRTGETTVYRQGNDKLANEKLIAYELGYRGLLRENLELNIEGFVNKHSNLICLKSGKWQNVLDTTTYGIETAVSWRPYNWWLVRGFYVYEHQTDENQLNETSTGSVQVWPVPHHKVGLTNRFYLDKSTTLNTQLFWSDTFFNRQTLANRTMVDPYFRFDIRLARRIWNDSAEIAFGVTNLTDHFHYEGSTDTDLSEVPRQIYMQFFYKF